MHVWNCDVIGYFLLLFLVSRLISCPYTGTVSTDWLLRNWMHPETECRRSSQLATKPGLCVWPWMLVVTNMVTALLNRMVVGGLEHCTAGDVVFWCRARWFRWGNEVGRVGWGRPGGRRRVGEQVHGPELRMKTPHMGCMPACIVLEAHHSNHLSPHQHSTNMVARSVLNACDSTNFSHHFCLPFVPSIMLSHTGHIHCLWDSDRQKKMFF